MLTAPPKFPDGALLQPRSNNCIVKTIVSQTTGRGRFQTGRGINFELNYSINRNCQIPKREKKIIILR